MKFIASSILVGMLTGSLPAESSADGGAFLRAVSVCAAIANPQAFDGKYVLLKVVYRVEPHGAVLTGRGCPESVVLLTKMTKFSEDSKAKILFDALLDQDEARPIEVVYDGTFRVIRGLRCSELHCFRYEFNASKLVAVRRLR